MKIKDIYLNLMICDQIQEVEEKKIIYHHYYEWDDNFLYLYPQDRTISCEQPFNESFRTIIPLEEEVEIDRFIVRTKNNKGEKINLYCFLTEPVTYSKVWDWTKDWGV